MIQTQEHAAAHGRTEETRSRSEKVWLAKSAFGTTYADGRHAAYQKRDRTAPDRREGHSFGWMRMLLAGALFFVCVTALHYDVSYHGWNRETVYQLLSDSSRWNQLVNEVETMCRSVLK